MSDLTNWEAQLEEAYDGAFDLSDEAQNIIECMSSSTESEENVIAELLQQAEDDDDFRRMLRRIRDIANSALKELTEL